MNRKLNGLLFASSILVPAATTARAQVIDPAYAGVYNMSDLGSISGVPTNYGGLTLKYNDPNVLLIGGAANGGSGAIYSIGVTRAGGHIIGFSGSAVSSITAPYNDGGVVYGPGNVLFLARWPVNELGQSLPNSSITDKVINLAPLGVEASLCALNFVPPGVPGAGRMKTVSYSQGEWNDVVISPDGLGTFNIDSVTEVPSSRLSFAPEGFVYVAAGQPLFPNPTMLVAEYGCGNITAYDIDAQGNPLPATRRIFISGLTGAEGAFLDPVSGDFLFSTFGGANRVIVVRGFTNVCSTCRGDLNADNQVNGRDITQFITCTMLPDPPAGLCRCADMDHGDDVDEVDLIQFVIKLVSDPNAECP